MAGVEKPFLNDEMCDKSHELFELWDTDGDGEIDLAEFKELFKKWDPDLLQGEAYQDLLMAFDNDMNMKFDFDEFRNFIRYMGREAHYKRNKKRRIYQEEMAAVTAEVTLLLETMSLGLKEFEFLLGFIKPNSAIMPTIQLNLTLLYTNHSTMGTHLIVDTGDPTAIKKWWSNNVYMFQAAKNYVAKMKDMVDYFEDKME